MKFLIIFLAFSSFALSQTVEETIEILKESRKIKETYSIIDSANAADINGYSLRFQHYAIITDAEYEVTKKWEERLNGKGYLFYYRLEPYVLYVDAGRIQIKRFHETIVEIL